MFSGASASTLQDIKVPDSCGGYTYKDSGQPGSPVRNRFLYWYDCIVKLEHALICLDVNALDINVRSLNFFSSPSPLVELPYKVVF